MDVVSFDPRRPGIFAFGQEAVGVFAFGQLALGVVAIGQVARGVVAVGQLAVGVVAAGQGSIGLWHGSGMLSLAGQRGYGITIHLLPRLGSAPQESLPEATSASDILAGLQFSGWITAKLVRKKDGPKAILDEPIDAPLNLDAVIGDLAIGLSNHHDRVMLHVQCERSADGGGYREAHTNVALSASAARTYSSHRKRFLAYGKPPKGEVGEPASGTEIVVRSVAWVVAAVIVVFVTFLPLADALL